MGSNAIRTQWRLANGLFSVPASLGNLREIKRGFFMNNYTPMSRRGRFPRDGRALAYCRLDSRFMFQPLQDETGI